MMTVHLKEVTEIYMYNEQGYQTERWYFAPVGVLDHRYKVVYNDKGQLLEESKFDKGFVPVIKYVYAYDSKGMPIGRSLYSQNNTLLEKYIYVYDTAGRRTDSIRMDTYGNVMARHSFEYNKANQRTKETRFLQEDSSFFIIDHTYELPGKETRRKMYFSNKKNEEYNDVEFIYDGNGRLSFEQRYTKNADGYTKETIGYDSLGNQVNFMLTKDGKISRATRYTYNSSKKLVEETEDISDISRRLVYQYDEKGNQVELKRYMPKDKLDITINWQYEYDKTGNWIKRTQFIDGFAGEVITREIEYY